MSVLTDDVKLAPLSLVELNLLYLQVFGFIPLVENDTNGLSRLTQCRRISCIIENQNVRGRSNLRVDLVFPRFYLFFYLIFFLSSRLQV